MQVCRGSLELYETGTQIWQNMCRSVCSAILWPVCELCACCIKPVIEAPCNLFTFADMCLGGLSFNLLHEPFWAAAETAATKPASQ